MVLRCVVCKIRFMRRWRQRVGAVRGANYGLRLLVRCVRTIVEPRARRLTARRESLYNRWNLQAHAPYRRTRRMAISRPGGQAVIKVIGVGGSGSNAVNRMIESGLSGVDFIVVNTDKQSLDLALAEKKIQIGTSVTSGLGAGGNPEMGHRSAEESRDEIADVVAKCDLIFITAGMG